VNLQKTTALFTAFCFLAVFAGQNFAAAPEKTVAEALAQASAVASVSAAFQSQTIPERCGRITETENFSSGQVVVNIQDLHCHPQTQKNIAEILKALDTKYGIARIYVEGASGKVDLSWISNLKDQKLENALALQMVDDGRLTGAEYFALSNGKNNLFGLEDAKVHHENVARLAGIYEDESNSLKIAAAVKNEINYLSNKYLGAENKKFAAQTKDYRAGKTNSAQYYKTLLSYVAKINKTPQKYGNLSDISAAEYGEIAKVVTADEASSKLRSKRVSAELQSYVAGLKNRLNYEQYKHLLAATDNFQDTDELCNYIDADVKAGSLAANKYPQLMAFAAVKKMNSSVNPLELYSQEEKLRDRIRKAFSSSELESETAFLQDFCPLFEGYLTNNLTAKDEEYFRRNFSLFNELYAKYAAVNQLDDIKDRFSGLDKYYDTNNERNDVFISKIESGGSLVPGNPDSGNPDAADKVLAGAKEIIVVIAGGYHTQGLNEHFDNKKISHMTVTPKVSGGTAEANANYRQIITDQGKLYRQALAFTIASQTSNPEKFRAAVEAGAQLINSAQYSQETVSTLIAEMENLLGETAEVTGLGTERTEIKFANGSTIVIENNRGKASASAQESTPAAAESAPKIFDARLIEALAAKVFNLSSLLAIENEDTYALYKQILTGYADNGANFGVDGAIEEIVNSKYNGQSIDGIPFEIISRLPEFFQKAALARHTGNDSPAPKKRGSLLIKAANIAFGIVLAFAIFTTNLACGQNKSNANVPSTTQSSVQESAVVEKADYVAKSEVAAGKIIVTDKAGKTIDYRIKGAAWGPDRNGNTYYQNYEQSIEQLKYIGANSVRTYRPLVAYENGRVNWDETRKMLNAFQSAGITICMGFSYEDMAYGGLLDQFMEKIGRHPAILMFALGNEYNYHYEQWFPEQAWFSRLAEATARIKDNMPGIIVATVHGEVPANADIQKYNNAKIDLIMINVYEGPSGNQKAAQRFYALKGVSNMPAVFGETGQASEGEEGQFSQATQADAMAKLIDRDTFNGYVFVIADALDKENRENLPVIGKENMLGLFDKEGKPKKAADTVKLIFVQIQSRYISSVPTQALPVLPVSPASPRALPVTLAADSLTTHYYGGFNWRSFTLPMTKLSQGDVVEITLTGQPGRNVYLEFKTQNNDVNPDAAVSVTIGKDGTAKAELAVMDAAFNVLAVSYGKGNYGKNLNETNGAEDSVRLDGITINPAKTAAATDNGVYDLSGMAAYYEGPNWRSAGLPLEKAVKGSTIQIGLKGEAGRKIQIELKNPAAPERPGTELYRGVIGRDGTLSLEFKADDPSLSLVINYGNEAYGEGLNNTNGIRNDVLITKATLKNPKLELPFVAKLLDKIGLAQEKHPVARAWAVGFIEQPFIAFAPSKFLNMHSNETAFEKAQRARGIAQVQAAANEMTKDSYSLAVIFATFLAMAADIKIGVTSHTIIIFLATFALVGLASAIAAYIAGAAEHARWNLGKYFGRGEQVSVNFVYADSANLKSLSGQVGANPSRINGRFSAPVYILNETENMDPAAKALLEPTGLKIDGKSILVSSGKQGLIFVCEGVSHDAVAAELLKGKLERKLAAVYGIKSLNIDSVAADTLASERGLDYTDAGAVAHIPLVNGKLGGYGVNFFEGFRKIAKAEGWTRARSLMVMLDNVNTPADLKAYIDNALGKASNGTLIIKARLARSLEVQKLKELLAALHKEGVMVLTAKDALRPLDEEREQLFDGTFDVAAKTIKFASRLDGSMPQARPAEIVDGLKDVKTELEKALENNAENIVIYNSAIKAVAEEGTGLDILSLIKTITSGKIMKGFTARAITPEFAAETARNLAIKDVLADFPDITSRQVAAMYSEIKKGKSPEEIFAAAGAGIASAYLHRIGAQIADEADRKDVIDAFVQGFIEKLFAAAEFKEKNMPEGFKNKNAEKMIGRLMFAKYVANAAIETDGPLVRFDKMTSEASGSDATYLAKIADAYEDASPKTLTDMEDMIFALNKDVKQITDKDFAPQINTAGIDALLASA